MKKKKLRNIINEYQGEYLGQKVTVQVLKPKEKKEINNGRSNVNSCPNCLSRLTLDDSNNQKCSGDQLKIWEIQFDTFRKLDEKGKNEYLKNISYDSMFMELYDKWVYSVDNNAPEEYNCGFTNKIFLPIPSGNVTIADPVQAAIIERKLGRRLTEEEIYGESDLFSYQGMVLKEYRKGAKKIKITLIRFPEDC